MIEFCNAFIPDMIKKGYGRVINTSSGIENIPQLSPYAVSKAAVEQYTKDLAFQLKDTNVKASTLDTGWLRTDLGGEHAPNDVTSVLPGALVPVLLEVIAPNGKLYLAQDYKD